MVVPHHEYCKRFVQGPVFRMSRFISEVFSKLTLNIKRQCIAFFMSISSSETCYNDDSIKHLFLMLEGFETIVNNTGFYIESNTISKKDLIRDIGKVFETLSEVMEKSRYFPRSYMSYIGIIFQQKFLLC